MDKNLPRATLEELKVRWEFAKLPLVVVEGNFDLRIFRLLQGERHCDRSFKELDVWTVDAIDVPGDVVAKYDFNGTGAKQRVVSFSKEVFCLNLGHFFRGVVDRVLDEFRGVNHESEVLYYTDCSCMESYFWSESVLRAILINFSCDNHGQLGGITDLYLSIERVLSVLTAVRLVVDRHPLLSLEFGHYDKALVFHDGRVSIDLDKYVVQCKPAKGQLNAAREKAAEMLKEIKSVDAKSIINGHDLAWVLTFVLKKMTKSKRMIFDEVLVSNALVAWGLRDFDMMGVDMIKRVVEWSKLHAGN